MTARVSPWIQQAQASGQGLRNMRQRAQLMGGQFEIDSAPGRGTTVFVAVPTGESVSGAEEDVGGVAGADGGTLEMG